MRVLVVMDPIEKINLKKDTTIAMMREAKIPIVVFSIREQDAFQRVLDGQGAFTVICTDG